MNQPSKQDQEFYNQTIETDDFAIDENFNVVEKGGDKMNETYEAEIWLSTDGKHTVHAKMVREGGTKDAQEWVASTFKNIQDNLGTKADMWGTVFSKNGKKDIEKDPQVTEDDDVVCGICNQAAEIKSGVSQKTGKPWKGVFCKANKEHVKWL